MLFCHNTSPIQNNAFFIIETPLHSTPNSTPLHPTPRLHSMTPLRKLHGAEIILVFLCRYLKLGQDTSYVHVNALKSKDSFILESLNKHEGLYF